MKVEDLEKDFLALSEQERMAFLRKILPVFCRDMTASHEKVSEMFLLFTDECGVEMKSMFATMAPLMGPRRGGCCG